MTVRELKKKLEDLDDDMAVMVSRHNQGYGGLFDADAEVVSANYGSDDYDKDNESSQKVLRIA